MEPKPGCSKLQGAKWGSLSEWALLSRPRLFSWQDLPGTMEMSQEGVVVVAGGGEEAEWEWMRLWVVRSP